MESDFEETYSRVEASQEAIVESIMNTFKANKCSSYSANKMLHMLKARIDDESAELNNLYFDKVCDRVGIVKRGVGL